MISVPPAAVDARPDQKTEAIEVHVAELKQLFNSIDPSPFREKDLDPKAEDFIVQWARDLPREAALALVVHVDRPLGAGDAAAILRAAIAEFFTYRSGTATQSLRQLMRVGRTSLAIGLAWLAASVIVGDVVAKALAGTLGEVLRESLLIGGWVAMWRPMEIFLYDWWPIRADIRLYDRLAAMPVRIASTDDANSEAGRWDWPSPAPRSGPGAPARPQ